jgi:hypothetical protein
MQQIGDWLEKLGMSEYGQSVNAAAKSHRLAGAKIHQ